MNRRLQLCTLLFSWFLASGSQWDVLQTFAWGRMFATYSQTMPVARALSLTFNPENLCGVCESVGAARRHDDGAPPTEGRFPGKMVFVFQPADDLVPMTIPPVEWPVGGWNPAGQMRRTPPVPPPRALV